MAEIDTLEYYDKYLGPLLLGRRAPTAAEMKFPPMARMKTILANPEVVDIITSPSFELVREKWNQEYAGADTPMWYSERNDSDHYLTYMIAAIVSGSTPNVLNDMQVRQHVCIDTTGRGQHVINIQGMPRSAVYNRAHTCLFKLFTLDVMRNFQFLGYITEKACTYHQALCMVLIYSYYRQGYYPPRHESPIMSGTLMLRTTYPIAMMPQWAHYALRKHVSVDDLGYASLHYMSEAYPHVSLECTAGDESDIYMLTVRVYPGITTACVCQDTALKLYRLFCQLLARNGPLDMPLQQLNDYSSSGSQVIMDKCIVPRSLSHGTDAQGIDRDSWPLVRGDAVTGTFPYPIDIPDCMRTRVLTDGQVITQEFMRSVESTSYIQCMGFMLDDQYLVSPYLRMAVGRLRDRDCRLLSGGIVADETGTGKTLGMILACVQSGHNIIVVPDTLLMHWSSEVRRHTNLNMWEDPRYLNDAQGTMRKRSKGAKHPSGTFDVIVLHRTRDLDNHEWGDDVNGMPRMLMVSHSILLSRKFHELFDMIGFTRLVVDEAHCIHKGTLSRINALTRRYTWLISATPYENTSVMSELLQLDRVLLAVTGSENRGALIQLECLKYHHFTIRNKLDRTHLEVETIKQYCDMSESERSFFSDVGNIIYERMVVGDGHVSSLTRFFRIMERLGAGGYMHRPLIMQILRRALASTRQANGREAVLDTHGLDNIAVRAPSVAFCRSTDDCVVCMCNFVDPVQLRCGHVYCKTCMQGMMDLQMDRCATCRGAIRPPVYMPKWPEGDDAKYQEVPPAANEDENVGHNEYRAALVGLDQTAAEHAGDSAINMQGKNIAIGAQLDVWVSAKSEGDQLVMFTKEQLPAHGIIHTITSKGMSVLCAGVMGARKLASIANIEKFRMGEADVLLISNKYSDGFDLYMAKEVWLLNTDLSAAKMEQSQGRVMRVVQKHPKVVVRVFVYRDMFDDFLWTFRKTLNVRSGYRKHHLLMYMYYMRRNANDGSIISMFHQALENAKPGHSISGFVFDRERVTVGRAKLALSLDMTTGFVYTFGHTHTYLLPLIDNAHFEQAIWAALHSTG